MKCSIRSCRNSLTAWCASGSLLFLCACSTATIATRYAPLHPGDQVDTNFRVQASDSDGIKWAELHIFEHELTVQNGLMTGIQRPGGTWGIVKTWNFNGSPNSIDETFTHAGFPRASFIKYVFRVGDTNNNACEAIIT
jgi:hypothetical protein